MLWERPKSSALTINRRPFSAHTIIWNHRSGEQPVPGAQDEQKLLSFAQSCRVWPKHIKTLQFELVQQPPIDRSHQFRRRHGPALLRRQGLLGQSIEFPRMLRHARGELSKPITVLEAENFLLRYFKTRQLGAGQINASSLGVGAHVTENVRQLQGLAEVIGVIAAGRVLIAEN